MNNADRRVRRTKSALKNALAQLMLEKEIRNITINELTALADIHRATFYTHYADIYDLYNQLEDDVMNDLNEIFVIDPKNEYEDIYKVLIDYTKANLPIIKMFLSSNVNQRFSTRLTELLKNSYLNIWLHEDKKTTITKEMQYLTSYHIQGCLSIISLWIKDDLSYSTQEVIELLRKVNDHFEQIT